MVEYVVARKVVETVTRWEFHSVDVNSPEQAYRAINTLFMPAIQTVTTMTKDDFYEGPVIAAEFVEDKVFKVSRKWMVEVTSLPDDQWVLDQKHAGEY